jgi:hypothetical protein
MKQQDLPDVTPSVLEGAASQAESAPSKTRAAHTSPIDLIGGRRSILYSYWTQKRR